MASSNAIKYRREVSSFDQDHVRKIVASTGFFSDIECGLAVGLVKQRLEEGEEGGFLFLFCELNDFVAGYTCYTAVDGTDGSYDLYWIAVHHDFRGQGLGKKLMAQTEAEILSRGGKRVYAETSGRAQYEPTRAFYTGCGYQAEAVLKDFYAEGDDKVIFSKKLS